MDVRRGGDGAVHELLRRGIAGRPDATVVRLLDGDGVDDGRRGGFVGERLREAEIDEDRRRAVAGEEVCRLDVAMDIALAVEAVEGARDFDGAGGHGLVRARQREGAEEVEDDPGAAVVGALVEQVWKAVARQALQQLGLAREAGRAFRVLRMAGDLERADLAVGGAHDAVDLGRTAAREVGDDAPGAEDVVGGEQMRSVVRDACGARAGEPLGEFVKCHGAQSPREGRSSRRASVCTSVRRRVSVRALIWLTALHARP